MAITFKAGLRAGIAALALGATLATSGVAGTSSGNYLAAMAARDANDFGRAAEFFARALLSDPGNSDLMEETVRAYVGLGRFDRALPVAERMADGGIDSQIGSLVRIEEMAQQEKWDDMLGLQKDGKLTVAPLVDGLVGAWAEVGAGRVSDALSAFDVLTQKNATRAFGYYHKALALALAGDFEAADAILSGKDAPGLTLTRRGVIARVEILSQLEKNAEAIKVLDDTLGPELDLALEKLRTRLEAGETLPFDVVANARDGLAEVFFTVAVALSGQTPDAFTLSFSRASEALQPGNVDALLLSADLLESLGRYDLAIATYDRIPKSSDYHHIAELGRAEALRRDGKTGEAIEVLKRLSEDYDTQPAIFVTLGDALRRDERYDEATEAYDRAIELYGPPKENQWATYFSRGITEERSGKWDRAEPDFRLALKLFPDQPQVLNYLGYSFLEMNRNLDEALGMIERAAKARPDDGYIADSLGWAFYRLGRYADAVEPMERAVQLTPVDPVINDHLGDVYWAVGRKREAEFQWHRALSFEPEDKDATRIRRKLEVGLDAVLKEEGAEPLAVAQEH